VDRERGGGGLAIMGAHKATRVLTQYEEDKISDHKQYSKNYSQLDIIAKIHE
jgi:hypothetical protein